MNRFLKTIAALAATATILAATTASAADAGTAAAAPKKPDTLFTDEIVVKGNGFEIKRSEIEEAYSSFKANLAAQGKSFPDTDRLIIESNLTERIIVTKILLNRATDADRTKAKETSGKVMADSRSRFPSEEQFRQQLKLNGLTPEEFQKRLEEQSVCEEVLNREVRGKVQVSDEQLKKFYDENPAEFEQPEMVRASHILLSTLDKDTQQPLPPEKKKEKETEIKKLKARAENGEDFAALARQYSEDPGSKETGGEYTFPRGRMVKPFETAAFSLKTNQISDVVETQFGYHIIKLTEKMPAKKVELATAKTNLTAFLVQKEVEKSLPAYFDRLKQEYKVAPVSSKPR